MSSINFRKLDNARRGRGPPPNELFLEKKSEFLAKDDFYLFRRVKISFRNIFFLQIRIPLMYQFFGRFVLVVFSFIGETEGRRSSPYDGAGNAMW